MSNNLTNEISYKTNPINMDLSKTNTTKNPFNPAKVSRSYTASQWTEKENWYASQCANLVLSNNPVPSEIQQMAVKIDSLLSIARLDYAYVTQTYDKYDMQLKIEERRLFVALKQNTPAQYTKLKLTIEEMKGVVANELNTLKWNNTSYTLYELVRMATDRHTFMDAIIRLLNDKKDLLITHSGMLKIEGSLNNLTGSVQK